MAQTPYQVLCPDQGDSTSTFPLKTLSLLATASRRFVSSTNSSWDGPTGGFEKTIGYQGDTDHERHVSLEDQRRVVLEVLETRFNLRTHREQRLFDHWVMTLVRPGVLGPRLKRVDFNCAEIKREDAPRMKATDLCAGVRFLRVGCYLHTRLAPERTGTGRL